MSLSFTPFLPHRPRRLRTARGGTVRGKRAMPPNEPCPHCGELILDWHNEWYDAALRRAIYSAQAAMDCPLCRQAVLWFESRDLAAPPGNAQGPVYQRSAILAARWVPIQEPACITLARKKVTESKKTANKCGWGGVFDAPVC